METSLERVAELERANYAAMVASAQVTPGLEVVLRDDVILTSNASLPSHDSNHACLLRTTVHGADRLISEVEGFFQGQGLPATVYVSPGCTPGDMAERLQERGFHKEAEEEAWMVLDNLSDFEMPSPYPGVTVKVVTPRDIDPFSEVFMRAFNLPGDFAPFMAQLLEPSVGLSSVRHYLALNHKDEPIGTCSLLFAGGFGVLGSAGVLREHRGSGAATTLAVRAATDARARGVDTLMLQTAADTWLERFLRTSGFKRAFTRSCYILDNASSG